MRLVRAVPVQVYEIAIGQPQPFAVALQFGQLAPQGPPQGLQVGVGQADGRAECGAGAGHAGRLVMCLPRVPWNSATVPALLVDRRCNRQRQLLCNRAKRDENLRVMVQPYLRGFTQVRRRECPELLKEGGQVVSR
ncbi:hypothetical protein D3C76_634950 [compost metagenome]